MSVEQRCGQCATPHSQMPLGQWHRNCTCKTKRYWATAEPLPKDATTFRQLTGRSPDSSPTYGRRY